MLFAWQPFLSLAAAAAVGAVTAVPIVIYLVRRLVWFGRNMGPLLQQYFTAIPRLSWLWYTLIPAPMVCIAATAQSRQLMAVGIAETLILLVVAVYGVWRCSPQHWRRNSALACGMLAALWHNFRLSGDEFGYTCFWAFTALLLAWPVPHLWWEHCQSTRRSILPRFRLRALLIGVAIFALLFAWPQLKRDYALWQLEKYDGVSLVSLPVEERFRVQTWLFELSDVDKYNFYPGDSWYSYFQQVEIPGVGGRVFVAQVPHQNINDRYDVWRMDVRDACGRMIHSVQFPGPCAKYVKRLAIYPSSYGVAYFLIEIDRSYVLDPQRYYYLMTDDRVELVRNEYRDRSLDFDADSNIPLINSPAKPRDLKQWLASDDPVNQLRGLAAILFGRSTNKLPPIDEPTRKSLERLCLSPDPWICQEARIALILMRFAGE